MLNSQSTDAEVFAAYDDHSGYEITGSYESALLFQQACRILLRRVPKRAGNDGQLIETNPDQIRKELERCEAWMASHRADSCGGSRYFDLSRTRD